MYKRWGIITLSIVVALIACSALITFVVDPFQMYRSATWFSPIFENNLEPYLNAGMARHYDYDSVILGSSMTENFHPTLVDQTLGGTHVKLPFEGGMAGNHAEAMRLAFETRPLKRVIYCLDMYSFVRKPDYSAFPMPTYLYNSDPFDDVQYLLNSTVLFKQLPSAMYHNFIARDLAPTTRDSLYAWKDDVVYSEACTLASCDFTKPQQEMQPIDDYIDNVRANFAQYLQPYLSAHPDTEFVCYFPPYSTLQYYIMRQIGHLDFVLATKEVLTELLLPYPNVKLYDFTANMDWVANLNNYTDYAHHSPQVNDWITLEFAKDTFLVDEIYDVYDANDALVEAVDTFPVPTPAPEE